MTLKKNAAATADTAPIIHYEVYVRERTQWMLQVRFRANQKEEAINEAKLIEKTLGLGVKVVRETYFPENNTCEEVTAYVSQKLTPQEAAFSPTGTANTVKQRPPLRVSRGFARGAVPGGGPAEVPRIVRRDQQGESVAGLLVRLVAIIVVAVAVAVVSTGAFYNALSRFTVLSSLIAPQYFQTAIFAVFAATFLLVAVPLSLIFIGGFQARRRRRRKTRPPPSRPAKVRLARPRDESPDDAMLLEEDFETTVVVVRQERTPAKGFVAKLMGGMNRLFGRTPEPPPPQDQAFGMADNDPLEPDDRTVAAPPLETAAYETPPDWGLQTEVAEAPRLPVFQMPDAPLPPELVTIEAVGLERHRMTTMRFLGDLLGRLKALRPSLDAYNRFGVDLLMSGAVETLAEHHRIPEHLSRELLQECVVLLGTKPAMAESFCAKVEEYLQEPRYFHLVQAGREMMAGFLREGGDAFAGLAAALELWNKPVAKQAVQQIVTVMFTDMVGSTDMTQAHGDAAAQEVVRRHNAIVRQALAEFDGREVKHTGDGIMASFASTANAVDAAVAIQRAVGTHNAAAPDLPVHLRIGINAGEPIQEEDDLFGTTVQLAARVCAKAAADQVVCTNVVRELSQGKGRLFLSLGDHELKGFRDPVPLFEVSWQGEAP